MRLYALVARCSAREATSHVSLTSPCKALINCSSACSRSSVVMSASCIGRRFNAAQTRSNSLRYHVNACECAAYFSLETTFEPEDYMRTISRWMVASLSSHQQCTMQLTCCACSHIVSCSAMSSLSNTSQSGSNRRVATKRVYHQEMICLLFFLSFFFLFLGP